MHLDIRKKFFITWVVNHWHRLPIEVVDAPFLYGALKHLIQL